MGEEVDVTVDPAPATWAITSGSGTLTPDNGSHGSVRFTADDKAGNVTITATGSACSCTITFTVVQPASWTMKQQPGTNLKHTPGRPDCGWKAITYFHPNDVNFYRVEDREKDSQYVGTGSYARYNGDYHGNYPLPDRVSDWFVMNRHTADGSTDDAPDTVYTGLPPLADTGAAPPFKKGSGHFPITLQWRVVGSANVHDFRVKPQEDEIFENGRCESRKGDHTEHTMYDDAESDY
ncbi:MAG: hypothetical protein ABI822_23450 [Bryobacteraceae bacterium]